MRDWLIAACCIYGTAHAAPVGTTTVIERSVARVDGAVIWESEVAARMRGVDAKDRPALLESMIDDELIVAEARRGMLTVEKSDLMAALDEIKQQNKLDDAGLDAALREAGYTRARYLVELERQLLRLRAQYQFVSPRVFVTDADIEAEAKVRKKPVPVTEPDKSDIQRDLRRKATDAATVVWVAELRKRAWIERRP
ncbi:MAG: SurA N-terminal domain-containing protein [Myxococcota bacterium]|nr:SurA N-terminal domain-containing protein [Deltaproteobacteria bacterium]MDQ3338385.1 SurA N-terminal domain-containing protein [Myxococcota bacterium]